MASVPGPDNDNYSVLPLASFSSIVSSTFWTSLAKMKLEVIGLKNDPIHISGTYAVNHIPNSSPLFSVDHSSFSKDTQTSYGSVKCMGLLINMNTSEQFKELNKNELMCQMGNDLLKKKFESDESLAMLASQPYRLNPFLILTYADLKRNRFIFWFGFPSFVPLNIHIDEKSISTLSDQVASAVKNKIEFILEKGFFCIRKDTKEVCDLNSVKNVDVNNVIFGYLDPSRIDGLFGWMLRNYLAFIFCYKNLSKDTVVTVLSFRPDRNSIFNENSKTFDVKLNFSREDLESSHFVGWEKNEKGKFGPKLADLKNTLDPGKLAEYSVDFNLKLMKWRLFPKFDLDMMHETKCLLLGCGTLGCNVARCLMGWGFRHITFVDNGRVSYSNPVRQSLYNFDDCVKGGKLKCAAAAENMKLIFPGIKSSFAHIDIPMPGHAVSESTIEQTRKDFETLVKKIEENDVIFLLMDTRESRWLPTVLGAHHKKIVINAALGFDSFLVMRHGIPNDSSSAAALGCYFCSDVVAPGDSTKDRTLDQQCTVTRPGISMMAGAHAVELLAGLLHHPNRGYAKADFEESHENFESPLGLVPHTIRSFLSSGLTIHPFFEAFEKCTACSPAVLKEYESRGFDFILDVLNSSSDYLEKLTGLDKIKEQNQLVEDIFEFSDDSEIQ